MITQPVKGYSSKFTIPPAGIQLHLHELFFDFHISEWSNPDQIRTPERNMIFNVNFGLEMKYQRNIPAPFGGLILQEYKKSFTDRT